MLKSDSSFAVSILVVLVDHTTIMYSLPSTFTTSIVPVVPCSVSLKFAVWSGFLLKVEQPHLVEGEDS